MGVAARQPAAWIAIDDLDLRPPLQNTLRMGCPVHLVQQEQHGSARGHDCHEGRKKSSKANSSLPPLTAHRPFSSKNNLSKLPAHPLATQFPRRRATSKSPETSNTQHVDL